VTEAISRLEYTVKWRRTVDIDNVEAMAADCGAQVSLPHTKTVNDADDSPETERTSYLASRPRPSPLSISFPLEIELLWK
jgi:hypothetical protein